MGTYTYRYAYVILRERHGERQSRIGMKIANERERAGHVDGCWLT